MLSLWVTAIIAMRFDEGTNRVQHIHYTAASQLASSEEEASENALKIALDKYPISEGYCGHDASPTKIDKEALQGFLDGITASEAEVDTANDA